jgi:hypothetical protein
MARIKKLNVEGETLASKSSRLKGIKGSKKCIDIFGFVSKFNWGESIGDYVGDSCM